MLCKKFERFSKKQKTWKNNTTKNYNNNPSTTLTFTISLKPNVLTV